MYPYPESKRTTQKYWETATSIDLYFIPYIYIYIWNIYIYICIYTYIYTHIHIHIHAGNPGSIPGSGKSPGEGIDYPLQYLWASLVFQTAKDPPAMRKTWVRSLSWDAMEEGMPWRRAWQPTPVFLSEEPPWTEEPFGLQSMGLQRAGHDWVTKHNHIYI